MNVMVGDIFLGSEGWVAMADGVQAFKGESNELIMEERPDRNSADGTALHMQNFLDACRSRNEKDLHDGIANAYLSASLCHLANISYRVGRKLTLEAGPKFTGDVEATKMLTRPKYRAGFEV
jgi:hypothetical protein